MIVIAGWVRGGGGVGGYTYGVMSGWFDKRVEVMNV